MKPRRLRGRMLEKMKRQAEAIAWLNAPENQERIEANKREYEDHTRAWSEALSAWCPR